MASAERPRIALLATGGTISAVADAARGSGAGLDAAAQAQRLGEAANAELRTLDVARIPSRAMTPQRMRELAARIAGELAAGACDGVVVTHGTDTLEETAYALALMLERDVPVVLTGAMRLPGSPGFDGDANLRDALAAACDARVAALGPLVAFADELHLARWVAKVHTTRPSAFGSPGLGAVGAIVEGRVELSVTSVPSDHLGLPPTLDEQPVELVWIAAGSGERLVDAAAAHARGIVVAGTGGGHVPPPVAAAIERAVGAGVAVVVASRCGGGPMLSGTYDGPGGEQHLRELGAVSAGALAPLKARLRLQVGLALGLAPAAIFPV
jgi:L-asparaginase